MVEQQKLIRVSRVAEILDIPPDSVYTLARKGILPSIRLNRAIRFDPQAITQFIQNGGKSPEGK